MEVRVLGRRRREDSPEDQDGREALGREIQHPTTIMGKENLENSDETLSRGPNPSTEGLNCEGDEVDGCDEEEMNDGFEDGGEGKRVSVPKRSDLPASYPNGNRSSFPKQKPYIQKNVYEN